MRIIASLAVLAIVSLLLLSASDLSGKTDALTVGVIAWQ